MIRGIKFVSVPVKDQDAALAFWTEKCGFKVATDQVFGPQRWIELMIPGAETGLVLFTMPGDEARIGYAAADVVLVRRRLCDRCGAEGQGREVRAGPEEGELGNERNLRGSGRKQVCAEQPVAVATCRFGREVRPQTRSAKKRLIFSAVALLATASRASGFFSAACRSARTLPKCVSRRWRVVGPTPGMASSSLVRSRISRRLRW